MVCLHKALRRQNTLPFSLWSLLTSVVLNCQTLISPYSAPLYKDEELVGLTVSSCWPFPLPRIPTLETKPMKLLLLFLSLPASRQHSIFQKVWSILKNCVSRKKIKTDIRKSPDVGTWKCTYGEKSSGRKDWTASKVSQLLKNMDSHRERKRAWPG